MLTGGLLLSVATYPLAPTVHVLCSLGFKHQEQCANITCKSWLQETEEQFDIRYSAELRQRLVNKPNHGVRYPEDDVDAHEHTYYRQLKLTPTTARELGLLADLIGWTAFTPVLLDMASRPGDCIFMHCTWGWNQSWELRRVWGGFTALKVLSSKYERLSNALIMVICCLPLLLVLQRRPADQAASQ